MTHGSRPMWPRSSPIVPSAAVIARPSNAAIETTVRFESVTAA
jgi:hypothetical protein